MNAYSGAGALLLCAIAHSAEELRFEAPKDTTIEREWTRESRRTLTKLTVSSGDESKSADAPNVEILSKARLLVTDAFEKVEDGRALKVVRTYDAIEKSARESSGSEQGGTLKEVSDLEGRSIVFEWDEDKSEYAGSLEGEPRTTDTPIESLVADMDLLGFLPAKPVSPGDKWPVPFEAIRYGYLRPGGRLEFRDEEGRRQVSRERALSDAAWQALDGECTATLKSCRDESGAKLCVIELAGKLSTSADLDSEDGSMSVGMKHTETFEGELVWDASAHRARSMDIESKIDFTLTESGKRQPKEGPAVELRRTLDFVEESTCTYAIRAK
jgi:hypothetical protein